MGQIRTGTPYPTLDMKIDLHSRLITRHEVHWIHTWIPKAIRSTRSAWDRHRATSPIPMPNHATPSSASIFGKDVASKSPSPYRFSYKIPNGIKKQNIIFKFIFNSKVTYYSLKLIIFIHFIPFSFLYSILRFSHISYIG